MKVLSILIAISLLSGFAQADWGPDLDLSQVWMDYQGSGPVSLLVTPDGSGMAFNEAMTGYGETVDSTIHLMLIDWGGLPIPGYQAEDIWLESEDGGLIACVQGTCADINGDLVVNLADLSLFATDFFVLYNYRSDFHFDGILNLLDVTRFAQCMSAECP